MKVLKGVLSFILVVVGLITVNYCISRADKTEGTERVIDESLIVNVMDVENRDQDFGKVVEIRDPETGVHYYIYYDYYIRGGMGGITPRYNADGTLYVD